MIFSRKFQIYNQMFTPGIFPIFSLLCHSRKKYRFFQDEIVFRYVFRYGVS